MIMAITSALKTDKAALGLLDVLLDSGYDSVLITDASEQQKIIYANSAFELLTGYSAAELFGKSPKILQGPSTDREETARLGRLLREGQPFEGKAINYRKDGSPFMMSWRVLPVRADGEIVAWAAIQREYQMKWQPE